MRRFSSYLVNSYDPDEPKGTVHHGLPKSHLSHSEVEKHWHDDHKSFRSESVPVHKIKTTQAWVNPKWKPKRSQNSEPPHGIRTSDGTVHLSDGHHRFNHAIKKGDSHFTMHVKNV